MLRKQSAYARRYLAVAITSLLSTGTAWAASAPPSAAASPTEASTGQQADSPPARQRAAAGTSVKPQSQGKKLATLQAVVVTAGIAQSQMQSIQLKQLAPSIQDSITAENIDALPDVSIADSLQRVTGVQIQRTAGVGTALSVRGLPQVQSLINGAKFITANQITSQQPNFQNVPSQLFAGVDVIKAPTGDMPISGISGTIDLRTRHPWDLKNGWTIAGSAIGSYGQKTTSLGPQADVLFSYNAHGTWGAMLGATYSNLVHENSTSGIDLLGGEFAGENASSAQTGSGFIGSFNSAPLPSKFNVKSDGSVDVNGDGKTNGAFFAPETMSAFTIPERDKNLGLNGSFQVQLNDSMNLTVDGFFTKAKQFDRASGYELNAINFFGASFVPTESVDTGIPISGPFNNNVEGWNQAFFATTQYTNYIGDLESYAQDNVTSSVARNFNANLQFDNGGIFSGSLRAVRDSATQSFQHTYTQFSASNGTEWPNDPLNAAPIGSMVYPGGDRVFNAGGFEPNTIPVVVNTNGDKHLSITSPADLTALLSNPDNYSLKTIAGEGDYSRGASITAFRAQGNLQFNNSTRLSFGLRNSLHAASNTGYQLLAPVYAGDGASDPNGCLVHYIGADVLLNGGGVAGACTAGNAQGFFRAGSLSAQPPSALPLIVSDNMKLVTSPGGVQGLSVYALDPKVMDDSEAYINALYPGVVRNINPANLWRVQTHTRTAYASLDFGGSVGVPFSGNLGMRVIRTGLSVTQHRTGAVQPNFAFPLDAGPVHTERSYTDVLPALNVNLRATPRTQIRFAYSKNMMPLNLDQWGGGLTVGYGLIAQPGAAPIFAALSASSAGNPNLNPWRSKNMDLSWSFFANKASMLSVDVFRIGVSSFIESGAVRDCDIPDEDGIVRRCVALSEPIQGQGASIHGVEVDYKQALTMLPGWLGNTGFEVNATYSPSSTAQRDMEGRSVPFQDNSKKNANLILWYQSPHWQFRAAGNYRSRRAVVNNYSGVIGLEEYQASAVYVDLSAQYKISNMLSAVAQVQNVTNEGQKFFLQVPAQLAHFNVFERTYRVGLRLMF